MAQLIITLNQEEILQLMKGDREGAFATERWLVTDNRWQETVKEYNGLVKNEYTDEGELALAGWEEEISTL